MKRSKILLILILTLATVLRTWSLDSVPVSLFGDELDVGYHAYSILKTGKDYSGNFLPMHLRSLVEWRTPLYIYSAVPTVGLFGISPLGVRLPAAIFGILGVWLIYLLAKKFTGTDIIALLSALFLAISPWHIQYSRAGFEVTEMLFFYMAGLYLLLRGLGDNKWLPLSSFCLGITPWVYNTAKLFLPLTIAAILVIWWKDLIKIPNRYRLWSLFICVIIVGPFTWNTLFAGGTQRIAGISIFNDDTVVPKIGFERLNDIKVRNNTDANINQTMLVDKLFHNQPLSYLDIFIKNYFQAYSSEFLFTRGDINLRHSAGSGEFYKVQALFFLIGIPFLLTQKFNKKANLLLVFWLVSSPIPSALTKDGGSHATRLILMLPPLTILISLGVYNTFQFLGIYLKRVFIILFSLLLILNFISFQHNYWIHYPWQSERWWHAGYKEAIKSAVMEGEKYEKVIISSANEPSLIFFLAYSMFPPNLFHTEINSTTNLGKYEFPPVGKGFNLYEIGANLAEKTLYLATAKEIVLDLNKEPQRLPNDIKLIKTINYPSGGPAFYLFTKP